MRMNTQGVPEYNPSPCNDLNISLIFIVIDFVCGNVTLRFLHGNAVTFRDLIAYPFGDDFGGWVGRYHFIEKFVVEGAVYAFLDVFEIDNHAVTVERFGAA